MAIDIRVRLNMVCKNHMAHYDLIFRQIVTIFFLAQEPLLEGIPPEAESQNPRLGFFLVIPMMSKWIGTGLYSIPNDASSVFIIYSQPPLWFSGGG